MGVTIIGIILLALCIIPVVILQIKKNKKKAK